MQLSQGSAIVVGGAGGFGSATVRRLINAGGYVVVADFDEERGTELAEELGERAIFVKTDVTSDESIDNLVARAVELAPLRAAVIVHGGKPAAHRLVNRDGETYPVSTFSRTLDVFLTGTFRVLSKAAQAMAKNEPLESGQRGVIITTASIAAYEGRTGQTDYSAAKGGIIGMNLTAARDLAPVGVRVMCISPGVVKTPLWRNSTEEQMMQRFPIPNPKRPGYPDEYAALAEHIIANDYLNGEVIRLDAALRM
ncbi:SDR family NAD(P)-dependent oxidoreductase [Microbacterium sp. zg-YB36]|uniref:SDR family NAD(P)-dependent oxidoreductase n=1 Tax=Microbacterium sp. zg-YB36 TaxID=2969407 RepID=UPI00214B2DBE|nr:SDR family NAD(P)-dependent oxidoreductase [Microbacterium sp. zg-YB36]MDL5353134.1 SDR family NAD(P)-dependent oxidoreductase [Microbacterium sp. zg-YB36]